MKLIYLYKAQYQPSSNSSRFAIHQLRICLYINENFKKVKN